MGPKIHSWPQLWHPDLMINLICPCLYRKIPFIEGNIISPACWATVFQHSGLSCNKAKVFPNWFTGMNNSGQAMVLILTAVSTNTINLQSQEVFFLWELNFAKAITLSLVLSLPLSEMLCLLRQLAVLSTHSDKVLWKTNHWVYTTGKACKRVEWRNIQRHTSISSAEGGWVMASAVCTPYRWYNMCSGSFWNPFIMDDSGGKCFQWCYPSDNQAPASRRHHPHVYTNGHGHMRQAGCCPGYLIAQRSEEE